MISHVDLYVFQLLVTSCSPEKDVATTIQESSRIPKIAKEPDDKTW